MADVDAKEQTPEAPVRFTDKAVEMAKQFMEREGLVSYGLRIAVVGGGCSGLKYDMGFEPEPREDDIVIDLGGVRLFVAEASRPQLEGITVDYVSALQGAGFKFMNPRATRTCGCGESFAA